MSETAYQTHQENDLDSALTNRPDPEGELKEIPAFVEPLFALVTANGGEVRSWSWMGGAQAPLSKAIYLHPRAQSYLQSEDIPAIMAEIQQGLAQKSIELEIEEPKKEEESKTAAEEDNGLEEEPGRREESLQQENDRSEAQEAENSPRQATPAVEERVELAITSQVEAQPTEADYYQADSAKTESAGDSLVGVPEQPAQETAKEPVTLQSANARKADTAKPSEAEESTARKTSVEQAVTSPDNKASKKRTSAMTRVKELLQESKLIEGTNGSRKEQVPTFEIPKTSELSETAEITEAEHTGMLSPIEENNDEALSPTITEEIDPEAEIIEGLVPLAAEIEAESSPEKPAEQAEQELQLSKLTEGLREVRLIDERQPAIFDEDEIIYLHPAENGPYSLDAVETLVDDDQITNEAEEKVASVEQEGVSLDIEEIEKSLAMLTECIEGAESEEKVAAHEIMDKIIEVSTRPEEGEGAKEELKKLFAELFNRFDIDYSPELIEALAALTLKWNLMEEIKEFTKEEATNTPHDRGTHEIIKKLLAGLSKIKKAIMHACKIGKSALRLYGSHDFTFARAATPATIV